MGDELCRKSIGHVYLYGLNEFLQEKMRNHLKSCQDYYKYECKGIKYITIEIGLVRAEISDELPIQNKLGNSSHRSSVQTPSNIGPTRAQAIVIYELSLFKKFGIITAL